MFLPICFAAFTDFSVLAALVREGNFELNMGVGFVHVVLLLPSDTRAGLHKDSKCPPSTMWSHSWDQSTSAPHPDPGVSKESQLLKKPRNSWQKTSRWTRARASAWLLERWPESRSILTGPHLPPPAGGCGAEKQGKASCHSSRQGPAARKPLLLRSGGHSRLWEVEREGKGRVRDKGRGTVQSALQSAAPGKRPLRPEGLLPR